MKNIDEWVEWMTRNPKLAEKYYPELMQGLIEKIKNSEPYLTALIIQKLPDHFPKWKTEAEKYFGIKRTKMIQGYINLIKMVLTEYEYTTEIEQNAVESVQDELTEQLECWQKELKTLPPQQSTKPKPEQDEVLSLQITHPKRTEIAKAIKGKYKSYKGKDFKILYEALLQLDLFPKKGKRSMFFRCLQNENYNINNFQMLEDKYFKTGYKNPKGNYEKSEDEIQRDEIIEYLKTIIETM